MVSVIFEHPLLQLKLTRCRQGHVHYQHGGMQATVVVKASWVVWTRVHDQYI